MNQQQSISEFPELRIDQLQKQAEGWINDRPKLIFKQITLHRYLTRYKKAIIETLGDRCDPSIKYIVVLSSCLVKFFGIFQRKK